MVRRYMPTYRKSKKLGTRKLGESAMETGGGGESGRSGDRIPTAQWKEENSTRCQRFNLETINQINDVFLPQCFSGENSLGEAP